MRDGLDLLQGGGVALMFGGFAISETIAVHLKRSPPAVLGSDVAIAAPFESNARLDVG